MDNINNLGYEQLIELQEAVRNRLSGFNPIRLKKKWKRCGKDGCPCGDGPADGSWGNLHGPYVFAQFTDNGLGRIRSVSLGRRYDEFDRADIMERALDFSDYYQVDPGEYEKMSPGQKEDYRWCVYLTSVMYEKHHGVSRGEDTMDRYDKFYGTQASHDAWQAAQRDLEAQKVAAEHDWAIDYGIGSVKGQMVLRNLLAGDYYLKL